MKSKVLDKGSVITTNATVENKTVVVFIGNQVTGSLEIQYIHIYIVTNMHL